MQTTQAVSGSISGKVLDKVKCYTVNSAMLDVLLLFYIILHHG